MGFRLVYPENASKRAAREDDRQAAIDRALAEANDHTVEVWGEADPDDVMLVRYEKRPSGEKWSPPPDPDPDSSVEPAPEAEPADDAG